MKLINYEYDDLEKKVFTIINKNSNIEKKYI